MRWGEEKGAADGTFVVVDIWRRPHLPFLPHIATEPSLFPPFLHPPQLYPQNAYLTLTTYISAVLPFPLCLYQVERIAYGPGAKSRNLASNISAHPYVSVPFSRRMPNNP